MSGRVHLFVGPSRWGLPGGAVPLPDDIVVHPPAVWGDLTRFATEEEAGVVALVDGRLHDLPPPGHVEIRGLLSAGWQVWGCSSIGAARAVECEGLGMRGFGGVYEMLRADEEIGDDELAVLYGEGPDWRPVTEPLVHVRAWATATLRPRDAETVVAELQRMWFGDRTPRGVEAVVERVAGIPPARLWSELPSYRWKPRDLAALLRERPWRRST